jgi:anaerobic dimethyl sulfoxide reductase subunit A
MPAGTIYQRPRVAPRPGETVVTSTCGHNCGGRCVVNAHVVDGRIERISSTRPSGSRAAPLQACARGFGQIERVYHPDRHWHPRRGAERAAAASLAFTGGCRDEAAREMRVRARYGTRRSWMPSRSGSLSALHGRTAAQRFLYMFGGCTELWLEHVGGGGRYSPCACLRRQGRLQERRAQPTLTSTQADPHVG